HFGARPVMSGAEPSGRDPSRDCPRTWRVPAGPDCEVWTWSSGRKCDFSSTGRPLRTRIGFRFVRLALMIEGQEGVTWDDWVALASACEEHGVEALFRSDHYISWFDESRHVVDARATNAGLAASTAQPEHGTLVSPAPCRHPAVRA